MGKVSDRLKHSALAEEFCEIIREELSNERAALESAVLDFSATQERRGAIRSLKNLLQLMGRHL